MPKAHPERVHPEMARQAINQATQRSHAWTEYILLHFRSTGKLAPGCDARDLLAWLEQNEAQALALKTGKVTKSMRLDI